MNLPSSMASSTFLLLFFLLLSGLDPFADGSNTLNLIQTTCKKTKYADTCESSLKSDPTSPNATDTKALAVIMAGLGMANATATSSYLSSQLLSTRSDAVLRKVLKECADKYSFAAEALQGSAQDLGTEAYDYAYMHVMAASDYPNACHNAFRRYRGLAYPPDLAVREAGLKRICAVVLGMIDLLA